MRREGELRKVEMEKSGKNLYDGRAGPGREVEWKEGEEGMERDSGR